MAVDAAIHLAVVGIAGEGDGLNLGVFLVFVVKADVGVSARLERGCGEGVGGLDAVSLGGVWLEIDEKYEFVGTAVVVKIVELPCYFRMALDGHGVDFLAFLA